MIKSIIFFIILSLLIHLPVYGKEPVTINFWHAMDGIRGETLNKMITEFNSTHPDIKVVGKFVGVTDYNKDKFKNSYNILFQELLINISTQTPPDIAQVYENWTSQFISIKALIPVEDFIKDSPDFFEKEVPDIVPTFLDANKYDGKLWTLPFNKSIYVLYYNKDVFAELGLTPPENWEQIAEIASKLTKKDESGNIIRWGLTFKPDVDTFSVMLLSKGGSLFDKSGKAVFNQGGKEIIDYMKQLIENKSASISFDPSQDFMNGKCAMIIESTARISAFQQKSDVNYGVALCPADKEKGKILFAGTNLAIFSTSPEKQKASWEFMRWITSTDNTIRWAMATGYLPVRNSAINSEKYQTFLNENDRHKVGVMELNKAIVAPKIAPWQSIRGIIDDTVFNSLNSGEDVQQALDNAVSLANQFLSR